MFKGFGWDLLNWFLIIYFVEVRDLYWSRGSNQTTNRIETVERGLSVNLMSFPNKEVRTKCWDSRDRYWECLDKNSDDDKICNTFRKMYEGSCPAQWVKHFDRKRQYLQFKDKIQNEGYEPIDAREAKT
uniref:Cytochrome c oxidase assembly factor 6 n=1 Tax=Strigamia maritima TaxID=126957 RepID=T1IML3_STRMM